MYKETIKVYVDGQELELYTIGKLAQLLKRSVETVRAWERSQTIPRPMYRYKNNVRLYHPLEVQVMKQVLKKLGKYAKREELKEAMWYSLSAVRKEILSGAPQKPQS
jgi:DNA-binding transcriptional MerR regulator